MLIEYIEYLWGIEIPGHTTEKGTIHMKVVASYIQDEQEGENGSERSIEMRKSQKQSGSGKSK